MPEGAWQMDTETAAGYSRLHVKASSDWADGFRPKAIRITYVGLAITKLEVSITDDTEITVPAGAAYESGTVRNLSFSKNLNLKSIIVKNSGGSTYFTNIEFFI